MAYNKTTWENAPSTNSPINASNLNKIEEGIYQNSLKADQVGDLSTLKTTIKTNLVNAINELKEEIYYKDNDTFVVSYTPNDTNRIYTTGLITGVTTNLLFTLTTGKSLKNINSISINKLKMNVRNYNGNYVEANGYTENGRDYLTSLYTTRAIIIDDFHITINILKNSGTFSNATNNTTQNIEIDNMELEFNE